MPNEPTAPAWAAARALLPNMQPRTDQKIRCTAEIIDREAGLPDLIRQRDLLLAACKSLVYDIGAAGVGPKSYYEACNAIALCDSVNADAKSRPSGTLPDSSSCRSRD